MLYLPSPAKLNLCLFVLGRRQDGYHDILSVVHKVDLCDAIYIDEHEVNEVSFDSIWEIPSSNTVTKTLELISTLTQRFYKVRVKKNIPPGGGLGGASSNAAALLSTLCPYEHREELAEKIGADVTLFLKDSPAVISGKGEKVSKIEIRELRSALFVVVFPGIQAATHIVYRIFDDLEDRIRTDKIRNEKLEKLLKMLEENELKWKKFEDILGWNDLEEPLFSLNPVFKEVKNMLMKEGRFYLTGSGSSFFSVFFDPEEALHVQGRVKRHFEFCWVLKTF